MEGIEAKKTGLMLFSGIGRVHALGSETESSRGGQVRFGVYFFFWAESKYEQHCSMWIIDLELTVNSVGHVHHRCILCVLVHRGKDLATVVQIPHILLFGKPSVI